MREEERRSTEVPPKFLRSLSPPPWLFLALSPSLFPFLLPIPFSSGSSQIVVSYRSTTGKWQRYKDTHTHTQSHPQGEGSKHNSGLFGTGFSFKSYCMVFNCALFVSVCMCGWIDGLLMFHVKHTLRRTDLFFASCLCLQCGLQPRTTALW